MGRTTEGWARLPVGSREHRQDAVLALVLGVGLAVTTTLYGAVGVYGDDQAPWWTSALMIVANAAPIAFRRRWPMTVAVVSALAYAATQLLHVPEIVLINFTLFIALYTVGAWCSDRVRARGRPLGDHRRDVRVGVRLALVRVGVPSALPNDDDALIPPYVAYSLVNILINVLYFGGAWYDGQPGVGSRGREAGPHRTHRRARVRAGAHRCPGAHPRAGADRPGTARRGRAPRVADGRPGRGRATRGRPRSRTGDRVAHGGRGQRARTAVEELRRMLGTLREDDRGGSATDTATEHGRLGRCPNSSRPCAPPATTASTWSSGKTHRAADRRRGGVPDRAGGRDERREARRADRQGRRATACATSTTPSRWRSPTTDTAPAPSATRAAWAGTRRHAGARRRGGRTHRDRAAGPGRVTWYGHGCRRPDDRARGRPGPGARRLPA